ncbi:MAG: hypothetical protein IJQ39_10750 [Thermoguttaceae bacterium]|nr:hypothetical protein [Thermoguttaceae bacterium]
MIFLAAGLLIAFSTACGKELSADLTEPPADPSATKTSRAGTGKEGTETSENDAKPASENPVPQNKQDELSVPTRPKRTISIGIRKIFAPESEIQKWPLGNNKYTTINAQEFDLKYELWRYIFSNSFSDLFFTPPSSDVYIQSARYYGTVNESGDLSGWGEWKVVVNQQLREERVSAIRNYQLAVDSSATFMPNFPNNPYTLLLTPSSLKILLSDFVFYDSSVETLPEPKNESEAEKESPFQVDSETYYPVEKDVVSATFPNGQTVLYIPSQGTVRFRWKAKRHGLNGYQIQTPGSVESLWTIDVPSDKKITLHSDGSDSSTEPLCAVVAKEKNETSDSWRYSIRWSESETAVVHISSADEKEDRWGRFYQQQTTYKFTQFNLNTQCRVTFEPDSRSSFPQEIPFSVAHDPHIVWEASFDGQPAEVHLTETGYRVYLSSCKTDNPRPELLITSSCQLDEVKSVSQEAKGENDSSASSISSLFLPRIELQSGRWQSGTALIYTLQSPKSVETDKCNVVNSKRVAFRQYQTIVEHSAPDADVVLSIEPYKELFYSQTETVVQWDGSQASFISSIDLYAEEGHLYSLTAALPEGLIIDQVSSEEQPDMIEDWEVYSDSENPAKRTLTVYLRKSLCPGQSLTLKIRSHAIADWSKPIELYRLAPIVFDRFESHTQTLFVNVAINQRFLVGERVLYSPEQEIWASDIAPELPIGIECSPHTSPATESGTGRIDAYEFCIDLKMWGNCLASLEPIQSNYTVNAKTTVWADQNCMEERIELAFSGERSHVNQFRFSYGNSSEASIAWQGLLSWSNNQYKIKVEPIKGNVFAIEIPRNVSSPFTVVITRKFDWNQKRAFEALKSNDCSRLTSSVSVFSRTPQLFDIHTYGMKYITSDTDNNADFTIGTYEYELKDQANGAEQITLENQDSGAGNDASSAADAMSASRLSQSLSTDSASSPRIELSLSKVPKTDVSIWAWNQIVEERHFTSGNILTSAQWTIENRFPPQNLICSSNTSNTQLKITLPSGPAYRDYKTFLTGVRIDNESVGGDSVIRESENSYIILLPPKKKVFVLTVQWASFDQQLNNYSSFEPQKPILNIPTIQSSWNLYYPTSYRRMNSFLSYDSTVDGWLERFFGPLLRHDSENILGIVSQIWDDDPDNQGQETGKKESGNNGSEFVNNNSPSVKADSNSVTYTPSGFSTWNCCHFDGHDAPHNIWIIRSEVSECIRWLFFIITVSTILTLYFKRIEKKAAPRDSSDSASVLRQSTNGNGNSQIRDNSESSSRQVNDAVENKNQSSETPSKSSWGFRRWIFVFCGVCCILCQTLPWLLSLPFSGAFLGTIICLLVLAVPFKREKTKGYEESTSAGKSASTIILNSRTASSALRIFSLVVLLILCPPLAGQAPVLPPPSEGYNEQGADERKEFDVFIPVDKENRPNPKNGYYVPQELLDLTQPNEKISPNRSWIVYRTQYNGKLFQKPRRTDSGLWKCVMEIETLAPNVVLDLPTQLPEMITTTSNISVSRGQILKSPNSKPDEETSENTKSETLYWSWNKLDNQAFIQLNPQNELWNIRLAQPGRYLIEVEFRPTIVTVDNKNLISFSVLECANSTLELLVPENITGLEFPDAYSGITELTPNMELPDPSIPLQPGLKLKRIQLGASKQLSVRWNAGGFLSDGPVFDVDTITWWNVTPESVDVKVKYNVTPVSGAVSSLEISADERLALSNEEMGMWNSELNNSSFRVTKSDLSPGAITVEFDNPLTTRTSFELHFIWKDALGVGRLQFPTTSVDSSRSGQRALAFTFDSRLQYECASESLKPMSAQSFVELWRGFQKQNSPVIDAENDKKTDSVIRNSDLKNTPKPGAQPTAGSQQTISNALPTVAYDLNLSRRKTDSSGVVDSVVMNVQRTKASSEGKAEAFVLVDWERMLWQIKWTINISRGECSGYTAILPESMCKPENRLSIISAIIEKSNNDSQRSSSVSTSIDGNELRLYWGTPVEGECQLTVTGEFRPIIENVNSDSPRRVGFGFPEIKTLNVTQYKLAIGRTDDSIIQTFFDRPSSQTAVWTQAELPVDIPFSGRNQRLLETWQTTINDSSKKPCALSLEVRKNNVSAEIDAAIKLAQDNPSSIVVKGRIKVKDGILDEFLLDVPENCGAPVSSKTTLNCQLDKLSITQQRYYLRPLSPYTSDTDFELTIPLKEPMSGNWKLEKRGLALWSVVYSGSPQTAANVLQLPTGSSQQAQIRVFGLKMFVSPINENEYCATAEFACAVSGTDSVLIQLPKGSKVLNVQSEQRSVRWIEKNADQILAPVFADNDPVDVRIVYTSALSRTMYTDPMAFAPPTIENAQQPEILWMVLPWKNFNHPEPTAVRTTSFINKQIWLIDELNSQFQFLKTTGNVSPVSIDRFSSKLDVIEYQLMQYENRGEKIQARLNSNVLIPTPKKIQKPNPTSTETGTIYLAMQNVLRLREALDNAKAEIRNSEYNNSEVRKSQLSILNSQSFPSTGSLVGTSAPGTSFVLSYSLQQTAAAPSVSIWQILSMLLIPVIIWLAFFPPEPFIIWRPSFVLGCLSVIWLICFNLSVVSILLFIVAVFDAVSKMRQRSKRKIIPLSVR